MTKKPNERSRHASKLTTPGVGPSPTGRASQADIVARRRWLEELMERGVGPESAARQLSDVCAICIDQARRYVTEVRNEWARLEDSERPNRRASLLRLLETNAERALEQGEYAAVNGAVREMARITGLDAKTLTIGGVSPEQQAILDSLQLTPQQRRARLDAIGTEPT